MDEVKTTGTQDAHYNLISVIYHALQGAQTYALYRKDAEEANDPELSRFFQEVQEEETRRADRAKQLLTRRLNEGSQGSKESSGTEDRSSGMSTRSNKGARPSSTERGGGSKRSR